jgi:NitT/TauT family transport system permease protein
MDKTDKPKLFSIRGQVGVSSGIILGMIPIFLILAVWFILTAGTPEHRIKSPALLPSPAEVLASFRSLWFEAELTRSIAASAWRVICGFVIAVFFAFPMGIAMGAFAEARAFFNPLATFSAYLPIPALVPLTMSLFGIDELQKVMFLALAFFIYLLPLFVKAVDEVDNVFLQTSYTLGASKWQAIRHVLLGISLPKIIYAMRLGFGVGWSYIILVEMIAAERGLGHIIIIAQRRAILGHIYLVLLVIVLIAYLTDRVWVMISRRLFPYLEVR